MKGDRVPAEHHELGAGVVEFDQQITEVRGEFDHVRGLGTKRQGISARE